MGVEYSHYLIPRDNTYRPQPEDLVRLIDSLIANGFLPKISPGSQTTATPDHSTDVADQAGPVDCYLHVSGCADSPFSSPCTVEDLRSLGDQEFKIIWSVSSSNESHLVYPLVPFPEFGDAYYDLEIHLATDYVYHISEVILPFESVSCPCGQALEYYMHDDDDDWVERGGPVFLDFRIQRICPSCGTPFRPQDKTARLRDGQTGEAAGTCAGGATYLFAIVVDCGKGFAREGGPIRATNQFLANVSHALGQDLYEVGDIN
jgi:hypothetical protein